MNKTTNYQLNQWDADDQVRRTDFNEDNAKIDAAIKAVENTVNQERIAYGSYTGNGAASRTITLPWTPVLVVLFGQIFESDTMAVMTQNVANLITSSGLSASGTYGPSLSGDKIQTRHGEWFNKSGFTIRYIMIR